MGLLHDGTKICPVASILTRRTRCKLDLKLFLVKCSYVHVLVKLSAQTAMAMPTAECYYVFIPQNVLNNTKPLSLVTFINLTVSYICRTLSLYLLSLELYVGFLRTNYKDIPIVSFWTDFNETLYINVNVCVRSRFYAEVLFKTGEWRAIWW